MEPFEGKITEFIIPMGHVFLVKIFLEDSPGVFRNWTLIRAIP